MFAISDFSLTASSFANAVASALAALHPGVVPRQWHPTRTWSQPQPPLENSANATRAAKGTRLLHCSCRHWVQMQTPCRWNQSTKHITPKSPAHRFIPSAAKCPPLHGSPLSPQCVAAVTQGHCHRVDIQPGAPMSSCQGALTPL